MEPARVPLARIKRTMKEDPEVSAVSTAAVKYMASATQLFVGYFAVQAVLESRAQGRQRVSYRDFAQAVSSNEDLAFLGRLVPKTVPFGEIDQQRQEADIQEPPGIPVPRQEEQMEEENDSE